MRSSVRKFCRLYSNVIRLLRSLTGISGHVTSYNVISERNIILYNVINERNIILYNFVNERNIILYNVISERNIIL